MQACDQVKIKRRSAVGHGVRGANGNSQGVDPSCLDKRSGLIRVGANAGRVGAVFATDLPQLALNINASGMRILGDSGRDGDVFFVGEGAAVKHDGAEAERNSLAYEFRALGVVEVHRHRRLRPTSDRERCQRDGFEAAVVVGAVCEICRITGSWAWADARTRASAVSRWMTLNAPTPVPAVAAAATSSRAVTRVMTSPLGDTVKW